VLLENLGAFFTKTIARFTLQELVDEVSGISRPAIRDVVLLDPDLLGQNVITNLFSVLATVRALPKHALVCYNAHGKVVDCYAVVLSAHNLGSHIAWCTGCIFRIFGIPKPCNAQISHS